VRITEILQKCLRDIFGSMYASYSRLLLRAVEIMFRAAIWR